MFARAVLAALPLVACAADLVRDYSGYDFETYLEEFGKSYASSEEHQRRKALFHTNLLKVQAHNLEYRAGVHTWFAAVNDLADLTEEEFAQRRATKYSPSQHPVVDLQATQQGPNPDAVDWRDKGAVSEVKNQGECGSCWAFSATETLESAYQIASGKLLELAPQTFVNCVKNPHHCGGVGGCKGATMELAFNFTANKGIALASDMPYLAQDATCKQYTPAVKATGYVKNPANSAIGLETAIATKGPVSVTVAASSWQFYGGGIFWGCSQGWLGRHFPRLQDNTLDHGVQVVGYTKEYWIVRNSWGPEWGEQGYIRLSRESDDATFTDSKPADGIACEPIPETQTVGGECGVLFDTSYPTGVTAVVGNELIV